MRRVRAPFCLFRGTPDRVVDIEKHGQTVFYNAREPKKFIFVTGADRVTARYVLGFETCSLHIAAFAQINVPTREPSSFLLFCLHTRSSPYQPCAGI
jgi:hypothetical protein